MKFQHGEKIVFIGASLTDCGRRDLHAPYGNGYMSLIRAFVDARYPERGLIWENRGVGGDTVRQLAARWQRDAIDERPDWLSIQLPTNDVWRFFGDHPDEGVPLEEYEEIVRSLLQRAKAGGIANLIVVGPSMIESDRRDPMRKMIDQYGDVAWRIAESERAIFVSPQAAWDRVLRTTDSADWSTDRVHPDLRGHAVMAQAFLREIGFLLV